MTELDPLEREILGRLEGRIAVPDLIGIFRDLDVDEPTVMAATRSLLRRQVDKKATIIDHHGIRLDLVAHTVTLNRSPIDLTGREFALLELFMQNQGRVLTRSLITEKIWDSHDELDANLLDVYMRRLRKKFTVPPDEQVFKTIRGVGYQMI